LRDADVRDRDGLFIVEGELAIRELARSQYAVRSVLLTAALERRLGVVVPGPVFVVSEDVLAGVVGFDLHRGAVAAAERRSLPTVGDVVAPARRLAVLEDLNDHENLGVLFRCAAAFGVDGVLLSPSCADPLYRRTVRVSLGQVLQVPFARVEGPSWPGVLEDLSAAGWVVAALTPQEGAEPLRSLAGGRVAVVVGAEGPGLSAGALAAASRRVRIPMASGVDSVNVATAAAIAFQWLSPYQT
jgi:tRNA G18 (ribose-2'-O)-methylase SpoU